MFPRNFVSRWIFIYLAVFALLSGCETNSSTNSATDQDPSSFTLPRAITQSKLSQTGTISAFMQVDGGTRQAMTVSGSQASITISSLSTGSHNFKIILEYVLSTDPGTTVTLGEATKNMTIAAGSNNLSYSDTDFNFSAFDDDSDGISNLDEMLSVPTQISAVRTSGNTTTPILEYNTAGDGMAVWEVSNIGRSLVYSIYDSGTSTWSTEAVLSSSTNSSSMTPQLVSNGSNFALVWLQYDDTAFNIYSSFYDGSAWSTPAIIDTEDTSANNPVLTSNGTGYAVSWYQDQSGQYRIFARISTDASTWGSAVVIDNSTTGAYTPKISSNGTDYAVIWQQDSPARLGVNIYTGTWSSGTAAELDSTSTYSLNGYDIASNGSGFSVVWYKYDGTRYNVYNRTYFNTGGFSWSTEAQIDGSSNNAFTGNNQSITSNGTGYAVSMQRYNGTAYDAVAVINAAGDASWGTPTVLESETDSINNPPIIASNGSNYATLWSQYDGASSYDLFSSVYNGTSWSNGVAIEAASSPIYGNFVLAGSGSQYIATWYQQVSNIYNVYANVFDTDWGLVQALETGSENVSPPSIELNPSGGVTVAWSQSGAGVFTNLFDSSSWGGEVALTTSVFGGSSYSPMLVSNGAGKTLAIWRQYSGSIYNLYASIHENGDWSQPQVLSSDNVDVSSSYIHAASDGTGFAVIWTEYDGSYTSIFASVYNGTSWSSGAEVDDTAIAGSAYPLYNYYGSSSITSNGNGYMLVYQQYDGSSYTDIYARAFDGSTWGTPQLLDLPALNYSAANPVIATNGSSYLASWNHYDGTYDAYSSEYDGASWSTAVKIVDGGASDYFYESVIRLVSDGTGYLAVWSQYDGATQYNAKSNFYASGSWGTPFTLDSATTGHQIYSLPVANSDGNGYAVAWSEYDGTQYTTAVNVYDGTTWAGSTTLDDGSSGAISFDTYSLNSLTAMGSNYAVVWTRNDGSSVYDAFASIYDGTNWSSATSLETAAGTVSSIQIMNNGSSFLAAWIQDNGSGILDIVSNRYDSTSGWQGETVLDSDTSNSAFDLRLYGTSDGYLATWTQAEPSGDASVRFPWARIRF